MVHAGWKKMKKEEQRNASCKVDALVPTAFQELNIALVRGKARGARSPWKTLCVLIKALAGNRISFMPKRIVGV